jgi:hypothetical protein
VGLEDARGANSPSLWPTMFSVTYTAMKALPLWTLKVWPMKSGVMVERRDQVWIGFARAGLDRLLDLLEQVVVDERSLS